MPAELKNLLPTVKLPGGSGPAATAVAVAVGRATPGRLHDTARAHHRVPAERIDHLDQLVRANVRVHCACWQD